MTKGESYVKETRQTIEKRRIITNCYQFGGKYYAGRVRENVNSYRQQTSPAGYCRDQAINLNTTSSAGYDLISAVSRSLIAYFC